MLIESRDIIATAFKSWYSATEGTALAEITKHPLYVLAKAGIF